ncbi:hypothetical protein ID866_9893 [Astraeus odoratus]|nr:hypothetical protein ID866_9893 [Astraeus odoratus]
MKLLGTLLISTTKSIEMRPSLPFLVVSPPYIKEVCVKRERGLQ